MKTTLDLPDNLVKQVKLRAVHEGRKLKDEIAHLLRKGLAVSRSERQSVEPVITKNKKTGLPQIVCKKPAAPDAEMTPDRVAEILLEQEAAWHVATR